MSEPTLEQETELRGHDHINDKPYCPCCDEVIDGVELGDPFDGQCPRCLQQVYIEATIGYVTWKRVPKKKV